MEIIANGGIVTLEEVMSCFDISWADDDSGIYEDVPNLLNEVIKGEIVSMNAQMATNCPDVNFFFFTFNILDRSFGHIWELYQQ